MVKSPVPQPPATYSSGEDSRGEERRPGIISPPQAHLSMGPQTRLFHQSEPRLSVLWW